MIGHTVHLRLVCDLILILTLCFDDTTVLRVKCLIRQISRRLAGMCIDAQKSHARCPGECSALWLQAVDK